MAQAYAELETDTPGTVFGVTQKTDGKSNTSYNKTKTQGEHDNQYETHDKTREEKTQFREDNQRIYKVLGIGAILAIAIYLFEQPNESGVNLTDSFVRDKGIKTEAEYRALYTEQNKHVSDMSEK